MWHTAVWQGVRTVNANILVKAVVTSHESATVTWDVVDRHDEAVRCSFLSETYYIVESTKSVLDTARIHVFLEGTRSQVHSFEKKRHRFVAAYTKDLERKHMVGIW